MIEVLRIGHRPSRDKRITTHVGLVSRAFGAQRIYIPGNDNRVKDSIGEVVKRFGGDFEVDVEMGALKVLRSYHGMIVHLTMYGMKLTDAIHDLQKNHIGENVLIVVGASKVPGYIFEMAHFNVSIGNQPHSEIAALSVFMDRLTDGEWMERDFKGRIRIIPDNRGKNVVETGD